MKTHKLTKNDIDIIQHYIGKDKKPNSLIEKTLTILSHLYGGLHHLPFGTLEEFDWTETFCIEYRLKGSLATTDFNTLTRLVFLAHEFAVRIELQSTRKNCIIVLFHERKHEIDKDFENSKHHPTIEQALAWFNR